MLIKTLDAYDLQNVMIRCDRDNFSSYGYVELIEYFDGLGEPIEVDPIAIALEFSEDDPIYIWESYGYMFRDFPAPDVYSDYFDEWCRGFVEELNSYTWAVFLDDGNIIYRKF